MGTDVRLGDTDCGQLSDVPVHGNMVPSGVAGDHGVEVDEFYRSTGVCRVKGKTQRGHRRRTVLHGDRSMTHGCHNRSGILSSRMSLARVSYPPGRVAAAAQ